MMQLYYSISTKIFQESICQQKKLFSVSPLSLYKMATQDTFPMTWSNVNILNFLFSFFIIPSLLLP